MKKITSVILKTPIVGPWLKAQSQRISNTRSDAYTVLFHAYGIDEETLIRGAQRKAEESLATAGGDRQRADELGASIDAIVQEIAELETSAQANEREASNIAAATTTIWS